MSLTAESRQVVREVRNKQQRKIRLLDINRERKTEPKIADIEEQRRKWREKKRRQRGIKAQQVRDEQLERLAGY